MEEIKEKNFTIGSGEEPENHASMALKEIADQRIQKLSRRLTLVSVFIPVLVIAVIYLAYMDIKKGLDSVNVTGAKQVESMSKELEDKVLNLSKKLDDISKIVEDLGQSKATNAALKKEIETLEKKIVNKMVDKKDMDKYLSSVKSLKNTVNEKTALSNKAIADIGDKIAKIRTEIADIWSGKIDKPAMEKALNEEKVVYREMTGLITSKLEKKIENIERKVEALKENISLIETNAAANNRQPAISAPKESQKSSGIYEADINK